LTSGSGNLSSSGAAGKSLGSALRHSRRSSSPVTAARTIERVFKHKVGGGGGGGGGGVSDNKPAGKASTESIVSSEPAGSSTEVTTEVVSA